MSTKASRSRYAKLRLMVDKYELAIMTETDKMRKLLSVYMGGVPLPHDVEALMKLMTRINQHNWGVCIERLQSLVIGGNSSIDNINESLMSCFEGWLTATGNFLRGSALMLRAEPTHFDVPTRRRRLASVLRLVRSPDRNTRSRACKIYRKFRFKTIVESATQSGRDVSYLDPTVGASYMEHRRVTRPVLFNYLCSSSDKVTEQRDRVDYVRFRNAIRNQSPSVRKEKMQLWLDSKNLSSPPRSFYFEDQVVEFDHQDKLAVTSGDSFRVSTGRLENPELLHPLANYWKIPIGSREKRSWYKWWRDH